MVRAQPDLLSRIDAWIAREENHPSRPEAIRRLVEQALGASSPRRRSKESKHKAAELAAREIDRLGDHGLTGEEQATRKRRLIKGPKEFRDVRGDQPKTKS
jgi:metal-responsive CopG/Arc/MetJ family transcriptional regulator